MRPAGKLGVSGALAGLACGLFGGGGGMVLAPLLTRWCHVEEKRVFANCVAVIFPLCALSAAVELLLGDAAERRGVRFLIGLMALLVWRLYRPGKPLRQLVAFFLAEALMVAGYFLTEWALTGFAAALAAVVPNLIQGAAGIALGMFCVPLMPRMEKALR